MSMSLLLGLTTHSTGYVTFPASRSVSIYSSGRFQLFSYSSSRNLLFNDRNRLSRWIVETLKTDGDRNLVPLPNPCSTGDNLYKGVVTIIGYQLIKVGSYEVDIFPVRSLNIEYN